MIISTITVYSGEPKACDHFIPLRQLQAGVVGCAIVPKFQIEWSSPQARGAAIGGKLFFCPEGARQWAAANKDANVTGLELLG